MLQKMCVSKILTFLIIYLKLACPWRMDWFEDFVSVTTNSLLEGRVQDTSVFKREYDFVVIGSGSGGSVIANRLTEMSDWSVLLLEAGNDEIFLTDVPLLAALTQITSYNWGYKTDKVKGACLGLEGGVCNWPRGRGLGGTSIINFMLYTRGNRKDYDLWSDLGNAGWSYDEVLPYFLKSEDIGVKEPRNSSYHGIGGYLSVQAVPYKTPLAEAFLQAGVELGYDKSDPNGEKQTGFSLCQATIRNGRRCSASKAFLRPVRYRSNLHVSLNSRVVKILINPKTKQAYGVEFIKNRKRYTVLASKEVILSAGAIGSPHLLMLSGVGPREDLERLGIPVVADLRVGYNLQDHISLAGITFLVNDSITVVESRLQADPISVLQYLALGKGPYTIPGGAEAMAFLSSPYCVDRTHPDLELVLGAGALSGDSSGSLRKLLGIPDEFYWNVYSDIIGRDAFAIAPILIRPKSRGRISLKSRNPFRWPKMEPNYFQDEEDLWVLREGAKLAVRVARTEAFKRFNATLHTTPFLGCKHLVFESDEYWECCIRHISTSLHHQVGTCKMGPSSDPTAVVGPDLLVHGVGALRVVDASIMPVIPASHTMAPAYMIGEKAADMIKSRWGRSSTQG